MPFLPPALANLKVNIHNLDEHFSTLIERYKIIKATPADAVGQPKANPLEVLIGLVNEHVSNCSTDQVTARDIFPQLINEKLRSILQNRDEHACKQGARFLLGALLHRYFRLVKSYAQHNGTIGWVSWGFFACDVTSCRLFVAIRAALQLPSTYNAEDDLKCLDASTVVTALECFQSNMLRDELYKKYPHFADEGKNFLPYLQVIIDEHKTRGAVVLTQFKAIAFLQSLCANLIGEQQQIEAELDRWSVLLKREHADFRMLTAEVIYAHIQAHVAEPLRDKVADLLYTPLIKEELATLEHGSFIAKMKVCNSNIASYVMLGGCGLLLESSKITSELQHCIYRVLRVDVDPKQVTTEDKLSGMTFLDQFITRKMVTELDCAFFGSLDALKTELAQKQVALTERATAGDVVFALMN